MMAQKLEAVQIKDQENLVSYSCRKRSYWETRGDTSVSGFYLLYIWELWGGRLTSPTQMGTKAWYYTEGIPKYGPATQESYVVFQEILVKVFSSEEKRLKD